MTRMRLAIALAMGSVLAGCDESKSLRDSGPAVDVSSCIPAEMGTAYSSELNGNDYYMQSRLWLGRLEVTLRLRLFEPSTGEFEIDTPVNRDFERCTECVWATDFRGDGTRRYFLARYGRIHVDRVPDTPALPSAGSVSSLIFYESVIDFDAGIATRVEGGECLFLAAGQWNTAECQPGTSCEQGLECLPTYYSTRGACNPVGVNAAGQACSEQVPSTDCEAGFTCDDGECRAICDFWSSRACQEGRVCGASGECIPPTLDEAMLGEICMNGDGWWCGNDGTRYAGYCRSTASGARCQALCRVAVASDCGETEICRPFEDLEYGTCMPG